ncbi:MAG TPA: hypothetical protein VKU44_03905, partial [Terriglobia bacterium]|nr:hypothetical protein [Terriglobia bacterium]
MSGKRPVTSRLLRALTVVLGSVVILYLAGAAFLSTSWFHGYLLRRVTANLEALTGARVEIKRLDIRPLIFQAALSGLVLHGKEPPAEPPLFSAASVVLGLDPVSLLRRKLLLRRLDLDSAQASIHTYSDGSTNIPGPERSFVDALLDMSIGTLIVTRTNFSWDDQRVPVELSARNVAVSLSYSLDSYSGSFAASALELKSGSWPLPPLTVSTRLKFSRHSFEASEVAWRLAESRGAGLSGHGSLKLTGLPKPDAEFSLQASGDLAQAAQILRIRELKRGSFALQGQGTYRNGELAGGGRVQAREVVVHSAVFEADHIGFTTDYTLEGRHVALNKVSVSLLGGTVQGRVNVALEGSTPKFSARVELRGLDLESSLRAASEGQALLAPIPLAGSVGGAVDASWRGNFRGFESRFDLTLDPVEAPTGTQPVKGFAKGTVKTAPEVSIDLEEADFHTPHSSLNVKGSVGTQQSKLAVQLETSDFEEWKPLAESLLGRSDDLVLQSTA